MIILNVAVPFLIAMIVLYFWFYLFETASDDEPEEDPEVGRIVGVVRKPYEDDREIELVCTGIIITKNIALTLKSCLPTGKDVLSGNTSNYIITSGSKYWSKLANQNQVSSYFSSTDLGIVYIDGEFPAATRKDPLPVLKDTQAPTYTVKGWKYSNRKMYDPLNVMEVAASDVENSCDFLGSPVSVGAKLYALVKKRCGDSGEPLLLMGGQYQSMKYVIPQNDMELG
ncbi:hypothetical protein JTB14_013227 [Gonioctena quinquepunctata]|nr:hypothetical protein JTB14_013227 [Gonioctena quinquepunctata]